MSLSTSSPDPALNLPHNVLTNKDIELTAIREESDRVTAAINNQQLTIEQANPGDNPAFDLIGLTQLRNDPQFAGIDGSGFSVAVIDTGIDFKHPLIAPNYVAGFDFIDDDPDPTDSEGHGTHVSGIVGAADETIGVAPDAGLIGLRVLDSDGAGLITEIEDALVWVLENQAEYNITAVNLSLGIGFFTSELEPQGEVISDDLQRLEDAGVTVVSAAGNDYFANAGLPNQDNLSFPAISSTIAVGAVWQDGTEPNATWQDGSIDFSTGADRIVSFSQRLDAENLIFAPGAIINSTVPGGGIGENAGTSQASPHVAGAVALLQEASLEFSGRLLTPEEVNEVLRTTADPIQDGDDEDVNVASTAGTYFRINIYQAISEVKRRSDNIAPLPENNPDAMVYRFFRPEAGVHFYTASQAERDTIINNLPNYVYEGASFESVGKAIDPLTGAKPVYRFFNNSTGAHLYTISEAERESIANNLSNYSFEGIAYYGFEAEQPGSTPLYRFYNPNLGVHFYTPNPVERAAVLANLPDYQLEGDDGIAFYVDPVTDL